MHNIFKYIPFLYINLFNNNNYLKYIINISYLSYFLYNYRYEIIDSILLFKIKLIKYLYPIKDFTLIKVLLYKNLLESINVTDYFEKNNITNI